MWSAGDGFFWRLILRAALGDVIAPPLQKQIDLGHIIHIGDEVYHAVLPPPVLHGGEQYAFLGIRAELLQIILLDVKDLQLFPLPEQTGHIGLAGQFLVVLCQRPEESGQVFTPGRQQLDTLLGDLDTLFHQQIGNLSAYVHLLFHLPGPQILDYVQDRAVPGVSRPAFAHELDMPVPLRQG